MKRFKFNHENKLWDDRKAFHSYNSGFVEFENGELIVHSTNVGYRRGIKEKYGVKITTTRECGTQLYLDEECTQPIKRAWLLQGGQQNMALDYEQKVAVHLNGGWSGASKSRELPQQYHGAHAFWPQANQLPIPLSQFRVSKPDRSIKKGLVGKLDAIRAAVTAFVRINPPKNKWHVSDNKYRARPPWLEMSVTDIVASLTSGTGYSDEVSRHRIAHNGFSYPRADTYHDYLYFK